MTIVSTNPLAALFQLRYPYKDLGDVQRAHGLRGLALGTTIGTLLGLIAEFSGTPKTVLFTLAEVPFGLSRVVYVFLTLIGIINLVVVMVLLQRGRLHAANISSVAALYLIAILAYGHNQLNSFLMITFCLPLTAAGVLLSRRDNIIATGIIVVTVAVILILGIAGALDSIATGIPTLEETLVFGPIILIVASIILSIFAGGQRALLQQNLELNKDLQQATTAAQQAEIRWRSIVANAPVIITYTNPEGVVEFVNHTGVLPIAGTIGQPIVSALPTDQRESVAQIIRETAANRKPKNFQLTIPDSTGQEKSYETRIGAVEVESQLTGLTFITTDITERVRAAAEQSRLQEQVIEAQREALKELSTPVIPIADRVIAMPLVGAVDSARAREVTRALLAGITHYRAKILILDITGVPLIDTGVADHLNRSIHAVRLKGAQTIVSGVSDAVAETIVDLGIDWSGVETVRDLQTALHLGLSRLQNGKSQASQ